MDGTSKRWNQVVPSLASAGPAPSAELCDAVRQVAGRGYDVSIGLEPGRASHEEVALRLSELRPGALPTPSVPGGYAANLKFFDCLPEA